MAASNPPAEPPIPTIGHLEFCLTDFNLNFGLVDFACEDFVPLVFTRVKEALVVAFRFAAMALFMLVAAYAAHKPRLDLARLELRAILDPNLQYGCRGCPESFGSLAPRADRTTFVRLSRWTQTSQVLHVEHAKCCFHIRADSDDALFHTRTKKRNPNAAAIEQSRTPHSHRASGMHHAIKLHLFHCR